MRGTYHVIRCALPHLIESATAFGAKRRSGVHVILMSSVAGQFVMPSASDCQTSKHAINR